MHQVVGPAPCRHGPPSEESGALWCGGVGALSPGGAPVGRLEHCKRAGLQLNVQGGRCHLLDSPRSCARAQQRRSALGVTPLSASLPHLARPSPMLTCLYRATRTALVSNAVRVARYRHVSIAALNTAAAPGSAASTATTFPACIDAQPVGVPSAALPCKRHLRVAAAGHPIRWPQEPVRGARGRQRQQHGTRRDLAFAAFSSTHGRTDRHDRNYY